MAREARASPRGAVEDDSARNDITPPPPSAFGAWLEREELVALPGYAQALVASVRRSAKRIAAGVLPQSWLVVHGPRRRRRIALSFDDGPTELTREYLDVLASYGVCATFFLLGNACTRLPALAESIALAGHEIGGHGYTHRTFPELAGEALLRELRETDAVLPGPRNGRRLVRPPHGSVSPRSLLECVRAGFTTVLWSYDSGDSRMQTAPEILQAFERAPPRAGDIVLLHEDHRRTLEALPVLLERLTRSGYELVSVSDLFRGDARP